MVLIFLNVFLWITRECLKVLTQKWNDPLFLLLSYFLHVFYSSFNWGGVTKVWVIVLGSLLSILSNFDSGVVWTVLILPLISTFSSLFSKSLGTIPNASTTISVTVTLTFFHIFFSFFKIWVFIYCFTLWSARTAESTRWYVCFFFCWLKLDLEGWLGLGNLLLSF